MCVCIYVSACVCVCIVCMCMCVCLYVSVCAFVCMCVHVYVCKASFTSKLNVGVEKDTKDERYDTLICRTTPIDRHFCFSNLG